MWVFLATEVMFFGTLFLAVAVYRYLYPLEFEKASERLNWIIGGTNTLVLLLSSLTIVLAVHYAKLGKRRQIVIFLGLTALLGVCFLCLKGLEYYLDYVENLIPGLAVRRGRVGSRDGLRPDQVPHVKLFLFLYWVMTGFPRPARDDRHLRRAGDPRAGPDRAAFPPFTTRPSMSRPCTGTSWISSGSSCCRRCTCSASTTRVDYLSFAIEERSCPNAFSLRPPISLSWSS